MRVVQLFVAIAALAALGGCEVVGTIFEIGVWFGAIAVVLVVAIVWFAVSRFRRRD